MGNSFTLNHWADCLAGDGIPVSVLPSLEGSVNKACFYGSIHFQLEQRVSVRPAGLASN